MTTSTTIPMADLRDGLRAVIPGADVNSTTTPILNAVNLRFHLDTLTFQSTDRRVAMEYTLDTATEGMDASFTMRLDDAKAIVKAIPARAQGGALLEIQEDGSLFVGLVGQQFILTAVDGEFPEIARLFKADQERKIDGPLSLGIKQLTQLTTASKHLGKDPALRFSAGSTPTEPVMVTAVNSQGQPPWRALIMPRRY